MLCLVIAEPIRGKAHRAVSNAIKSGQLVSPKMLECADCGEPAECYDHRNYSLPLAVDAVCWRCNSRRGVGEYPKSLVESVVCFL